MVAHSSRADTTTIVRITRDWWVSSLPRRTHSLAVMCKAKRKPFLVLASAMLVLALLLASAYTYQRSQFIQKTNALFDPNEKAFKGAFLPWPLGRPSLFGGLDPATDRRIRVSLGYESSSISTNGMTLIIHTSDGSFFVHAN